MGVYVNPQSMTKEDWLAEHGVEVSSAPVSISELDGSCLPVCLTNNGPFTAAAAVAYSPRELAELSNPSDLRSKRWFWVEVEMLKTVSNL